MKVINIRDYVGHRIRIEPIGFDMAQTKHGRYQRMWAKVTVLGDKFSTPDLDLGTIQVFQHTLITQIKHLYVGRPITGYLVQKPSTTRGRVPVLELEEVN